MATSIKAVLRQSSAVVTQQSTLTLKNTLKDQIALKELVNVIEGTPASGDTLIYNAELQKYEVKPISANTINLSGLDGGTF